MKDLFASLGAGEKEMQAFLKMLELGAQPISIIAKFVGVPRSSMYVILDRLKALNLVEEFEQKNIKYVRCIPVKSLKSILESKEKQLEQILTVLDRKLPELEILENRLSITPKVKFHEGKAGVMQIYENILGEKEFYAFFNSEDVKRVMPEYHFKIPENLKKNHGKAKELLVYGEDAQEYKNKFNSKKHQIKILPKGMVFNSDTIICKDKIYMISYGQTQVSGIEILNTELATSQRVIFEGVWRTIP